eukprot:16451012-Heterocapsa_arctica.AAC.1
MSKDIEDLLPEMFKHCVRRGRRPRRPRPEPVGVQAAQLLRSATWSSTRRTTTWSSLPLDAERTPTKH